MQLRLQPDDSLVQESNKIFLKTPLHSLKVLEMQVPCNVAWLQNECGGFSSSPAPEGQRCSVHALFPWQRQLSPPHLSLAESPAVLCAETAKRGDHLPPHPQHGAGDSSKQPGNKKPCLPPTMRGLGRREAEQKGWTSFSGGKQYFPRRAKAHAHFPVLHKLISNMCFSQFYQNRQLCFAGAEHREEKGAS